MAGSEKIGEDFEIEYEPLVIPSWWASCTVEIDGGSTLAIGSGTSPIAAIAACIRVGIPRVVAYLQMVRVQDQQARAGKWHCPGCGVLMPTFTEATEVYSYYCLACRGPDDD